MAMKTGPGVGKSKYALKRAGRFVGVSNTRPRRHCDKCGKTLGGKRGHGFPSRSGRQILCGAHP